MRCADPIDARRRVGRRRPPARVPEPRRGIPRASPTSGGPVSQGLMTPIWRVPPRPESARCSMGVCAWTMSRTPLLSSTSPTPSSGSGPPLVRPSPTGVCTRASAPATSSSRWPAGRTSRSSRRWTTRPRTAPPSAARCGRGPTRAAAGWAGSCRCRTWRRSRRGSARQAVEGHRVRPDGFDLRWRQIGVLDTMSDAQLPFFVHWEADREHHPSAGGRDVRIARGHRGVTGTRGRVAG